MNTENVPLPFLHRDPLSLRAIDPVWVTNRAAEIAAERGLTEPDIQSALLEAIDTLCQRAAWNYREDTDVLVYEPSEESHPYLIAVPLAHNTGRHRRLREAGTQPPPPPPVNADSKQSSLKEEFENVIFEKETDLFPSDLDTDTNGVYINERVRTLWEGFKLYHHKLTAVSSERYKTNYNKALGRYVVAKIGNNGVAIFTKTPYRHHTKALAMEEANRLSAHYGGVFGVFRCLDIVENTEGLPSNE